MLRYSLVALFAISSLVSCKIDKKYENKTEPAAVEVEADATSTGKVVVTLNAIITEDDSFQLFYTEDGSLDFNGDFTKVLPVKGKPEAQDIRFVLRDEAAPSSLRLDIGDNKKQGNIILNTITVNYNGKSFVIKGGTEFLKYFQSTNVGTQDVNANSVTLVPKEIDGNYDPMFYPTGDLINALKTLLVK